MKVMWKKHGKLILAGVMLSLFALAAGTAVAADEKTIVTVGSDDVGEREILDLVVRQTGVEKAMMPLLLAQMSLDQRKQLADQVVTALLLSQAAAAEGLEDDADVALTLKWNRANTLAQAYINRIAENWSLKEEDLRKFYEENKKDYIEPESAHVRHILTETEEEASQVMKDVSADAGSFETVAEEKSIDPGSAPKGGDLGFITKGQTVPSFEEVVFSMEENSIEGPVESRFGWHVIQVLGKKPSHQQTFEEALPQLREDIQQWYLTQEVEKLKERFGVEVDEEGLANLGGFPAVQSE